MKQQKAAKKGKQFILAGLPSKLLIPKNLIMGFIIAAEVYLNKAGNYSQTQVLLMSLR